MSAVCTHLDSIKVTALPDEIAGCEDCLAIGDTLGAPAHVHDVRQDRLLRLLAEPPRDPPCRRVRPPDHPLRRAGRGLELVLHRRGRVRPGPVMTLPELHLADWRPTKDTLHLYCQIVGKIRLATTRRATTGGTCPCTSTSAGSPHGGCISGTEFEIVLDFLDHALVVQSGDGRSRILRARRRLAGRRLRRRLHDALRKLGVDVAIQEKPFGVPMTTPFREDTEHASWDHDAVARFGRILDWSDSVFEEFSGWFNGKTSPVHLFWHGFDLAVTRFSGRPSRSSSADPVTREAYSHEVISFGFWPGDDNVPDAAYYSYTAPEPEGLRDEPLAVGSWTPSGEASSLAILPYEDVRTSADPRRTLLAFCESAYEAGARLAGWDTAAFTSTACPTPDELRDLQATAAGQFGRRGRLTASRPIPRAGRPWRSG